jgi:hypothetical protein
VVHGAELVVAQSLRDEVDDPLIHRDILYAADGDVIGYQNVFTLTHLTWHDGTIVANVSEFRVSC